MYRLSVPEQSRKMADSGMSQILMINKCLQRWIQHSMLAFMFFVLGIGFVPVCANADIAKLPRFPSISPDGSEIVFSAGGDLWIVPVHGGAANRLTGHRFDDLHSSWSPDGQSLVFTSMRDGYMNLWSIQRDGTETVQLTYSDQFLRAPHWSIDGEGRDIITFSGLLEGDVYRDQRPYRISPQGGEHELLHQAFGSEPRFSPDGQRVVFTRGGYYHDWNHRGYRGPDAMNIWVLHRGEERFEAVTEWEGDDGSARWVDNDTLLFMSERQLDTVNLYRVNLDDDNGTIKRITHFKERGIQDFDVSRDGSTAVLQVWDRLYTLNLADPQAEPEPISIRTGDDGLDDHVLRWIDRDITEAVLSPDGQVMAYIAYGRIYLRHVDEYSPTQAVTPDTHARHQDIVWSPDGLHLYFASDANGTLSIYKARVELTRDEIRLAHEQLPMENGEYMAKSSGNNLLRMTQSASEIEHHSEHLHADGPYEPLHSNNPSNQLDSHDPSEPEPSADPSEASSPSKEERHFMEKSEAVAVQDDPARWHDAVQFRILPVIVEESNDRGVSPSPDGRSIAFRRGRGELVVMDLLTNEFRTLVKGWDSGLHWRWSPDGRYIAYDQNDLNFSTNIFIIPADGSHEPVNITRHPRNDYNPRWSADGRILTFISNRSGDSYDLYRVYLDPEMENWTRREFNDYYEKTRIAAGKHRPLPVSKPGTVLSLKQPEWQAANGLELENAWQRVERVTASPDDQTSNEMTPGGDRYVFNSGSEGLIAVNWDGSDRKRLGPRGNVQHLDVVGKRVIYIAGGRVGFALLDGKAHSRLDISDRIRIDLQKESLQKFRELARVMEEGFYRPDMKGVNWKELVADYEELIVRTRTANEFSYITNRLLGELSASHMGLSNPEPGYTLREPSGRLGIEYTQVTMEDGRKGYRITRVIPGGPLDRGPVRLRREDIITRIDMKSFDEHDSLLERLQGKVKQEVMLGFERKIGGKRVVSQAIIAPISFSDFAELRYDDFQEESRRKVSELSGGRIGYIHIGAMNQESLEKFQAHLYAAADSKEGLIIDVRNNGGGYTSDRILTSIMTAEHAYTVPAGAGQHLNGRYPQDRLDAPRYTLPINMLANEKSYSNSEILAHAFKTLGRGTLVGKQTYGGVISTGSHYLIDGASVRLPFRGWYLPDGTDMELNGAIPDLFVDHTPADEIAGRDRQLESAVMDLLQTTSRDSSRNAS